MCTVSFVPVGSRVFLTSNRDEKQCRLPAQPPLPHSRFGATLLFPTDGDKGGTWIAARTNGAAGVLLNGAAVPHVSQGPYRHSRGLVLPQLLAAYNPVDAFSKWTAEGIEPFTLVLYVRRRLYECRWDGSLKSIRRLPANKPHIWSSSTLYTPQMQERRNKWFQDWLVQNPVPDGDSLRRLHRFGGEGDSDVDYVMNRSDKTLTVSITSIELTGNAAVITYQSLSDDTTYRTRIGKAEPNNSSLAAQWRRFWVRLRHWEYWPFWAVYAPIYPYWFWLCLKARSLFFFSAANPTIRNGGFLMESKKEIYDLMPKGSYPHTALIKKEGPPPGDWNEYLHTNNFRFPLIAKPDIGLRGRSVKRLRSVAQLEEYHSQSKVDYLIQAYIPYENEAGIFYVRFPGQKEGKITGIVGKELLTVTGDGKRTVSELMQRENRFLLQLASLQKTEPVLLTQVLSAGETKLLVPYGNHSRGAKFLDVTDKVNVALHQTINALCLQVPGFYFGRLDIRFQTWEDLCAGKNFSVIELNGAGSEPAHIYDPKHSIFFGWREIIRHLDLLYHISKYNKMTNQGTYLSWKEGIDVFRQNAAYVKKIS